jgi:hypothetical protein
MGVFSKSVRLRICRIWYDHDVPCDLLARESWQAFRGTGNEAVGSPAMTLQPVAGWQGQISEVAVREYEI